jgi:hypothetical protein
MAIAKTSTANSSPGVLLIAPFRLNGTMLERAVAISEAMGAELEVCCPVVAPPVPHSAVAPGAPPIPTDERTAREEARRLAAATMAALTDRGIDAHIESGIAESMTQAVLHAVTRLDPQLILLPQEREPRLFEQKFSIQADEIAAGVDVPIVLLHQGQLPGRAVVGLIAFDPAPKDGGDADERVAAVTADFAARFRSAAHLVSCASQPLALASAGEAHAPKLMSLSERKENRVVRRLYDVAERYGIDPVRVHLHHGGVDDVLGHLVVPLEVGLVVMHSEARGFLARLFRRPRELKLSGLPCDLLLLGESNDLRS